jgi:aryl-alcohol dehydrogenase-like predicted oxidoreductase
MFRSYNFWSRNRWKDCPGDGWLFLRNRRNFIDTFNNYGSVAGTSKEVIERGLQGKRGKVLLSTKVSFPTASGVNDVGLSRKYIMCAVDESLRPL